MASTEHDHVCGSGVLFHLIITTENQRKTCKDLAGGQQPKQQFLHDKTKKQNCWMCVYASATLSYDHLIISMGCRKCAMLAPVACW